MKQLSIAVLTLSIALAARPGEAGVLPKEVMAVKEAFDKAGATVCSQAMAETLGFLTKGRAISNNRQWSTLETNKKPIAVDFLIAGTKNDYSLSGGIVLAPTGAQCAGTYIVTYVAPSENCKAYIQKAGFGGPDWNEDMTDANGDGGTVYFLTSKKSKGLNFIFNDVAGGCSVTKRETLTLDAGK